MKIVYRVSTYFFRTIMKLAGNYRILNRERLDNWESCIIAANHLSYFDPPFLGSIFPHEIYYLAKSELFKNPLFGGILKYFNAIPVKRGVVDRNTISRLKKILAKNKALLIFPEGSRKSFSAKPGIGILVYDMKVPILPVYIENSNHMLSCLFRKRRLNIYLGEKIQPDKYVNMPADKNTYRLIAEEILEKINGLPHEYQIG